MRDAMGATPMITRTCTPQKKHRGHEYVRDAMGAIEKGNRGTMQCLHACAMDGGSASVSNSPVQVLEVGEAQAVLMGGGLE